MGRKRTLINPVRAKRLKALIEAEGITQTEFAESLYRSQQSISRIITGKNALTEETAKEIIEKFPRYRLEWLLGYDPYMTQLDLNVATLEKGMEETDILHSGVNVFLHLSGYSISPAYENDGTLEGTVKAITSGYVISRDGQSITLDLLQFNQFANKISDYVDFELQHMIRSSKSD